MKVGLFCYFEKVLKIIVLLSLQGEMQQLRDKLAITERAAKSEAQLKVNGLF